MMDMLLRSFKANQALDAELGDDYARTYEVCGELCELMSSRGRPGRGASAGIYDYFAYGSKALCPGLADLFGGQVELAVDDIRNHLTFRLFVADAHCLTDVVLSTVRAYPLVSFLVFCCPLH